MEPTGLRREPYFTFVLTTIGVGAGTYLCYLTGAAVWICVIVGFVMGVAGGQTLGAWQNARMLDEVTALVVADVKTRLEAEGFEIVEIDGNGAGDSLSRPPED